MFLFAHVGITLGAAAGISAIISLRRSSDQRKNTAKLPSWSRSPNRKRPFREIIGLDALSGFLDIRILMVGSMLPDIIDKPLSFMGLGSGRSIAHTLLLSLIVLCLAFYLYLNNRKTWLFAVAIGMFSHLILDSMRFTPQTLLWPFQGWAFPAPGHKVDLTQFHIRWNTLITNPGLVISEGIGLCVILALAAIVVYRRTVKAFLIQGKLG